MRTSGQMVKEFHEALGHPIGMVPGEVRDERTLLRLRLVAEEVAELMAAMTGVERERRANAKRIMLELAADLFDTRTGVDLVEVADGCCDAHYVISGTAIEYGIPEDAVYEVVHAANMAKRGGPMREDGKIMRPEGWRPPDVEGVLRRAGWRP